MATPQDNQSSSIQNLLGTDLGGTMQRLIGNPTDKNLMEASTKFAETEANLLQQKSLYDKEISDSYLKKSQKELDTTNEKVQKLKDQQNWDYPSFHPTQTNVMELASIFSIVGVLGSVMGGGGRMASMNALGAMTGMMEGWKKGEKDRFVQEKATFDENLKVMEQKNNGLQKQIESLINDYTRNRDKWKEEYSILLAQNPTLARIDALKGFSGVIQTAQHLNDGMRQVALKRMELAHQDAREKHKEELKRGEASTLVGEFTDARLDKKEAGEVANMAKTMGEAKELKRIVSENNGFIGREGQLNGFIDQYIKSFQSGGPEPTATTPEEQKALVFAKRYASFLVDYERAKAGGARGFTVSFQNRWNKLAGQGQFNATGFGELMDDFRREMASNAGSYSRKINFENMQALGDDIMARSGGSYNPISPTISQTPSGNENQPRTVTPSELKEYAKKYNMSESDLKKYLESKGYKVGE